MSCGLRAIGGIIIKLMLFFFFFLESPLEKDIGIFPFVYLAPFRISEVEILLLGLYMIGWEI